MSDSPNIYLNEPDPLSVLLTNLNLTAEVYVNGDFCGTWAVDTAGSKRIPFHLISSGEAWLHFEGQEAQSLNAQDLVIFPHDSHHVISNSKQKPKDELINAPLQAEGEVTSMTCGFFEFRNPALFPLLDALPNVIVLAPEQKQSYDKLAGLIALMQLELKQSRAGFYTTIDHIAFLMFVEVLRLQMENQTIGQGLLTALFDPKLGKALNAIHQQPENNWTLETLAQEALMSRSTFADKFNKVLGQTPMKYLSLWRMSQARKWLQTTQMSVAQIADKTGYATEAAFRKAYKNIMGEPPGEARLKT